MSARTTWMTAAAVAVAAAGAGSLVAWQRGSAAEENLRARTAQRVVPDPATRVPCEAIAQAKPLVLLVLGQSNAANQGEAGPVAPPPVTVITDAGDCLRSTDPLPGATGNGASIWSRLPAALANAGMTRPLVLGVLAVDATAMREWTNPSSPLPVLLDTTVRRMTEAGLPPTLVLWQQGEADALRGTSATEYGHGLLALADRLRAAGVSAPWLLAQSTVCRAPPSPELRAEITRLVASDRRFLPGPDIDSLNAPGDRTDGCHFSAAGLQAAADLWALSVAQTQR